MSHTVLLRVYDISHGMAKSLSLPLLGKQLDGIWHTGLLVFGLEYFFSGGIVCMPPAEVESVFGLKPVDIVDLGTTEVTQDAFHKYLNTISHLFTSATYDLLRNNCNNFTDTASRFLLNRGIPHHIIDLPNEALSTPLGKMIAPMIASAQQTMQSHVNAPGHTSIWTAPPNPEHTPFAAAAAAGGSGDVWEREVDPQLSAALDVLCSGASSPDASMNTLVQIVTNILANTQEPKFRSLKKSNAALQAKILGVPGGSLCLTGLGFEERSVPASEFPGAPADGSDEECWVYSPTPSKDAMLELKVEMIKGRLRSRTQGTTATSQGSPAAPAQPTTPATAAPVAPSGGGAGGMDPMGLMQQMAANPALAQQMISNNPMLAQMAQSNPDVARLLQNPSMLQSALNSDAIRNAVSGALSGGGRQNPSPQQDYTFQLQQLSEMGFADREANIQALRAAGGSLAAAIDRLTQ